MDLRVPQSSSNSDLYACVREMPPCASQTCLKLQLILRNPTEPQEVAEALSHWTVDSEMQLLAQQLEQEGLSQLKLDLATVAHASSTGNTAEALSCLAVLSRKLAPFSIVAFRQHFSKSLEVIRRLENKDAAFLLGLSGVGKSTCLHYFSKSEMAVITEHGQSSIQPTQVETRSTSSQLCMIPLSRDLILVDTPGLEAASSVEEDVANTVSLVAGMKDCKKVRIVSVIGYSSLGDRMTGLKETLKYLTRFLSDVEEVKSSILFVITGAPESAQEAILAKIRDIQETLNPEERANDGLRVLIERIENQQQLFLNPLARNEVRSWVRRIEKTSGSRRPEEFINVVLSNKGVKAVSDQTAVSLKVISTALKKSNYALASFLYRDLVFLQEHLSLPQIQTSLQDAREVIDAESQTLIMKANQSLYNSAALTSFIQELVDFEQLGQAVPGLDTTGQVVQIIRKNAENVLMSVKAQPLNEIPKDLDTLRKVAELLNEISEVYRTACEEFERRCTKELLNPAAEYLEMLSLNNLYTCAGCLQLLDNALVLHTGQSRFSQLQKIVQERLTEFMKEAQLRLVKEECTPEEIQYIRTLATVTDNQLTNGKVPIEKFVASVEQRLLQLCSAINPLASVPDSYTRAIQCLFQIKQFEDVPALAATTQQRLTEGTNKLLNHLTEMLEKITAGPALNVGEYRLYDFWECLVRAEELKQFREHEYQQVRSTFVKALVRTARSLTDESKTLTFGRHMTVEIVQTAQTLLQKFSDLERFNIPELNEVLLMKRDIESELRNWLERAEKLEDIQPHRIGLVERTVELLRHCTPVLALEAQRVEERLLAAVEEFLGQNEQKITAEFEALNRNMTETQDYEAAKTHACTFANCVKQLQTFVNNSQFGAYERNARRSLERWTESLAQFFSEYEDVLDRLIATNQSSLVTVLGVAKELQSLEKAGYTPFSQVIARVQQQIREDRKAFNSQVANMIKQRQFDWLQFYLEGCTMSQVQLQSLHRDLKLALNNNLENIERILRTVTREVPLASIEAFVNEYRVLRSALANLARWIDSNTRETTEQALEKYQDRVKSNITALAQAVQNAVTFRNFVQAHAELEHIGDLLCTLDDFIDCRELHNMRNDLKQSFQNSLRELQSMYMQMPLSQFIYNPPKKLLKNLEGLREAKYLQLRQSLREGLMNNFIERIEQHENVPCSSKRAFLNELSKALTTLPEQMALALSSRVETFIQYLEAEEAVNQGVISGLVESMNVVQFNDEIERFLRDPQPQVVATLKRKVLDHIKQQKYAALDHFEQNSFNLAAPYLDIVLKFKQKYRYWNEDLEVNLEELRTDFTAKVKAKTNYSMDDPSAKLFTEALLEVKAQLVEIPPDIEQFFGVLKLINNKLTEFCLCLEAFYQELNAEFLDMPQTKRMLDAIRNYDGIIQYLRTTDGALPDSCFVLSSYSDCNELVTHKVTEVLRQLQEFEFPSTYEEYVRKAPGLWTYLRARVKVLDGLKLLTEHVQIETDPRNIIKQKIPAEDYSQFSNESSNPKTLEYHWLLEETLDAELRLGCMQDSARSLRGSISAIPVDSTPQLERLLSRASSFPASWEYVSQRVSRLRIAEREEFQDSRWMQLSVSGLRAPQSQSLKQLVSDPLQLEILEHRLGYIEDSVKSIFGTYNNRPSDLIAVIANKARNASPTTVKGRNRLSELIPYVFTQLYLQDHRLGHSDESPAFTLEEYLSVYLLLDLENTQIKNPWIPRTIGVPTSKVIQHHVVPLSSYIATGFTLALSRTYVWCVYSRQETAEILRDLKSLLAKFEAVQYIIVRSFAEFLEFPNEFAQQVAQNQKMGTKAILLFEDITNFTEDSIFGGLSTPSVSVNNLKTTLLSLWNARGSIMPPLPEDLSATVPCVEPVLCSKLRQVHNLFIYSLVKTTGELPLVEQLRKTDTDRSYTRTADLRIEFPFGLHSKVDLIKQCFSTVLGFSAGRYIVAEERLLWDILGIQTVSLTNFYPPREIENCLSIDSAFERHPDHSFLILFRTEDKIIEVCNVLDRDYSPLFWGSPEYEKKQVLDMLLVPGRLTLMTESLFFAVLKDFPEARGIEPKFTLLYSFLPEIDYASQLAPLLRIHSATIYTPSVEVDSVEIPPKTRQSIMDNLLKAISSLSSEFLSVLSNQSNLADAIQLYNEDSAVYPQRLIYIVDQSPWFVTYAKQSLRLAMLKLNRRPDLVPQLNSLRVGIVRGYSSVEDTLLEVSPLDCSMQSAVQFLDRMHSQEPGNAVEVALAHANAERDLRPLSGVLIIGAKPRASPVHIQQQRSFFGEEYWKLTQFHTASHFDIELAALQTAGVIVRVLEYDDLCREILSMETAANSIVAEVSELFRSD